MKEILNEKYKLEARESFFKAVNIGVDFKLKKNVKDKNTEDLNVQKMFELPVDSLEINDLLNYFSDKILPYCSNFSSENFMGFPDAGNSVAGISGAILSDFLQQNLINSSFCAPIATYMEIAVIKWLREILGYKINKISNVWDVGGIITYGGTGSNTTAMLLARENFKKGTMQKGVENPENFKVIIPKGIGHYSIKSALMWIGCGDNVIEVETCNYKYDLEKLEETLLKYKGKVMSVVVYVGDSRTMTIDNLEAVYKLAKSIDSSIWLHADACHGFSLAFSKKLKSKIAGIELYDSISTDPHKVLAIPYCISALLIKDPEKFKLVTSTSDLIMQEDFAFGQITPFIGSKSWISLKLWFAMKNFGVKKIGDMIEERCEMALYLRDQILNNPCFRLLNNVNINSVVFIYYSPNVSIDYLNQLNLKIYDQINKDGKYYLHKFKINDDIGVIKKDCELVALRYMSGNDNITKKDINSMLNYICKIGKKCEEENE